MLHFLSPLYGRQIALHWDKKQLYSVLHSFFFFYWGLNFTGKGNFKNQFFLTAYMVLLLYQHCLWTVKFCLQSCYFCRRTTPPVKLGCVLVSLADISTSTQRIKPVLTRWVRAFIQWLILKHQEPLFKWTKMAEAELLIKPWIKSLNVKLGTVIHWVSYSTAQHWMSFVDNSLVIVPSTSHATILWLIVWPYNRLQRQLLLTIVCNQSCIQSNHNSFWIEFPKNASFKSQLYIRQGTIRWKDL